MFQSPHIEDEIERIAINSKHQSLNSAFSNNLTNNSSTSPSSLNFINSISNGINSSPSSNSSTPLTNNNINPASSPNNNSSQSSQQLLENSTPSKLCALLAISFKHHIRLWLINDDTNTHLIGNFNLNSPVDNLFFIGSQLVGTSNVGKIGVWNIHGVWCVQDITPISCFDTAGSFLLLGGQNGVLYYIDMQKFPLRMKDNDLLVTELYKDPLGLKKYIKYVLIP